jgi:hypothetical protein
MHRTTSFLALGLFLGLAPIGAVAQTTSTDTDVQATQPADSGQTTETEVLKTDDQQSTDTDTMDTDDQQATDTDMSTDTQQSTQTGTTSTDTQSTQTGTTSTDDQQSTQTGTTTTDTQQSTETEVEVIETDDQQSTETEVIETDDQQSTETEVIETDDSAASTAAGATEEVIPAQEENEMLASDLLGADVNLADESIGQVSDLIIGDDHMIKGVVVGVGGFLGIGEKNVALSMDMITVQPTEEAGEFELSANTTREELESFEEFKTASDVEAEVQAEQTATQSQTQQPAAVPTQPAQPAEPAE